MRSKEMFLPSLSTCNEASCDNPNATGCLYRLPMPYPLLRRAPEFPSIQVLVGHSRHVSNKKSSQLEGVLLDYHLLALRPRMCSPE